MAGSRHPGSRERKKAETRRRIAQAGRRLLKSKGFEALTTQEVAVAAGIPPGTLFGYIGNKSDLLILALVDEGVEFVATIPARIPEGAGLLAELVFVYEEMVDYHGRDIEVAKHFLREIQVARNPKLVPEARRLGDALRAVVADIVAKYQARGELAGDLPAERASWFLFSHYWSALRFWVVGTLSREECSAWLREAIHWQIRGLNASPAGMAATDTAPARLAPAGRAGRRR